THRERFEADRDRGRAAHARRAAHHLPTQHELRRGAFQGARRCAAEARVQMDDGPKDSKPGALPRGASPADLDHLRAVVKVAPRVAPTPTRLPRPPLPPPPAHAPQHQPFAAAELSKILDDGRALLEKDAKAAHQIFEKAYRRNLNDPRVLSNYALTLVL